MSSGGARRGLRAGVLAFVGILLIQVAWIFAVPPFQGPDEREHAYKAAAVAQGDVALHHRPSRWGEFMRVPAPLVEAAEPVCVARPHFRDNCFGSGEVRGQVEIATAASRYNPAFYAVVGTVARGADGVGSLYLMRLTAAVMCAAMLAAAVAVLGGWARTRWPQVAFLAAMTPTVLFSSSIAGPVGIEMAAAVLAWSAGLALVSARSDLPVPRGVLVAMTAASCVLVTVRTLGPLWFMLIVLTLVLVGGPARLKPLLKQRAVARAAGLVALATALAVAWSALARTNAPATGSGGLVLEPSQLIGEWVVWFLQSVGTFPLRDDPAPLAVYALAFSTWAVLVWASWRAAATPTRLAMAGIVVVSTVLPIAVTVATYAQNGFIWQGRYTYPFAMGFLFLAGWALDRRTQPPSGVLVVAGGVFLTCQLMSVLHVYRKELEESPLRSAEAWVRLPGFGLTLLVVAGSALVLTAMAMPRARPIASHPALDQRVTAARASHVV